MTDEQKIEAALRAYPGLSLNGLPTPDRVFDPTEEGLQARLTPAIEPRGLEQFRTAVAWLERIDRTKNAGPKTGVSSYSAKHRAEIWGRGAGLGSYVSNGMLIAAAHSLGIKITPRDRSPNAWIGVSTKHLDYLRRADAAAQGKCLPPKEWRKPVSAFRRWVQAQIEREDPVGDVARDAAEADDAWATPRELMATIRWYGWRGADVTPACQALREAVQEWVDLGNDDEGFLLETDEEDDEGEDSEEEGTEEPGPRGPAAEG